MEKTTTLKDVRHGLREALAPRYGEREAAEMAKLIMMHLKGRDFARLLAEEDREASDYVIGCSREILGQLLKDMPLQYALGETSFYGLTLKVRPGVLIPRPETEELVDMIVRENREPDLRVLDLCTGSGAIAIALARNLPFSQVTAVDLSPRAADVARENAAGLKAKVKVEEEDIFTLDYPPGSFDIIVSNPPYVDESEKAGMEANVLLYEPHEAIFVPDEDPLVFYRRIAAIAREALTPGGRLYLEINPRHASELSELLESAGFADIDIVRDIHGRERFIRCKTTTK